MHKVAKAIDSLLSKANLTPTDFLDVTDNLINSTDDVESNIIALMAPLSSEEREQVMADLSKLGGATKVRV
jgi:hypothetical protein